MAFVAAPNIVMLELRALKDGQRIENRIHIDTFHEPTTGDLLAIATVAAPIFTNSWANQMPSSVQFVEVHQRSLHVINGIERTDPFGSGQGGTVADEAMPNATSLCVSLRTNFVGRSARGRLFWLGLAQGSVTENTVSEVVAGDIVASVESLRAGIASLGFAMVIVSYRTNNAPRVGGPVYFEVQRALVVDRIVDSQRRRKPGVGQ